MSSSAALPPNWVRNGTNCADCQQPFTLFTKKGNCCCCGGLFCSKCLTSCYKQGAERSNGLAGSTYVCKACLCTDETRCGDKPSNSATHPLQIEYTEQPTTRLPAVTLQKPNVVFETAKDITTSGALPPASPGEGTREVATAIATPSWQHLQVLSSKLLGQALALRNENDCLLEQLSAKTALLELTQRELQSADVRCAAAVSRAAEHETCEHALRAELAAATSWIAGAEETLHAAHEARLSSVEAAWKETNEVLGAHIMTYKEQLAERQAELDRLQARYDEQEHWVDELQRETTRLRDELSARPEAAAEGNKAVKKELRDTRIALSDAEARSTQLQSKLEDTQNELQSLRARLTTLRSNATEADAKRKLDVESTCRRMEEAHERQVRALTQREMAHSELLHNLQGALDASTERCQRAEEALAQRRAAPATDAAAPQTAQVARADRQCGASAADTVERRREQLSRQQQRVLGSMLDKIQTAARALVRRRTSLLEKEAKLRRREIVLEMQEAALKGRSPPAALATRARRTSCSDLERDTAYTSCSPHVTTRQVMSAELQHRAVRLAAREHGLADNATRLRNERRALVQREYDLTVRLEQLSRVLAAGMAKTPQGAATSPSASPRRSFNGRAALVAERHAEHVALLAASEVMPAVDGRVERCKRRYRSAVRRDRCILPLAAGAVQPGAMQREASSQLVSGLQVISDHLLCAMQRA